MRDSTMSWVAINGFSAENRNNIVLIDKSANELICKGSILCEFTSPSRKALRLVHNHTHDIWTRGLTIFRNADGSISIETQQGPEKRYAKISGFGTDCPDPLRVTFTWDTTLAIGHFSGENLKTGDIQRVAINSPFPTPANDCLRTVGAVGGCQIDDAVKVLAFADHIIAVGPGATLTADAQILTPGGERFIRDLIQGDLVTTKTNGPKPIRHIIRQCVPAHGHTCPVHLRAPFFELSKDLIVASNQRLLIAGAATEYDFGNGGMLIEAGELVGLPGARFHSGQQQIEYYQVLLESHECIRVCGTWTESLFIGQLARQPAAVHASLFGNIQPDRLPTHKKRALRILRNYEKRALFGSMIA